MSAARRTPETLPDLPHVRKEFIDQIYTHASGTSTTRPTSNDRLAYLGSAHLNAAISEVLFEELKDFPVGRLTEIRNEYNSNANVARWGQAYEFDKELVISPHLLPLTEPSRFVAAAFQAYLAATLLSSSQDEVKKFVKALVVPTLDGFRNLPREPDKTVVQTLHERLVVMEIPLPTYVYTENEATDLGKKFEVVCNVRGKVVGKGVGRSKDEAKRRSAEQAMRMNDRQFKILKEPKNRQD